MVDPKLIDSKALGAIPVTSLSGGTKTLILIYNEPQQIFIAPTCGDNCAKWFLKIAKEKRSNARMDDKVILERESWWKETLQSKAFGYNEN